MTPILTALLALGAASAEITINQAFQTDPAKPDVAIQLIVTDGQGKSIPNLGPKDFALLENGFPIRDFTVDRVLPDRETLNIGLLVDNSGSMKSGALDYAKAAATMFIQQTGPNDRIALFGIGDSVGRLSDFTGRREQLLAAVNRLSPERALTVLYDGMYAFLKTARSIPVGRTAMILMTDGRDEGSSVELDDVLKLAEETQIPIYTVGFGSSADQRVLRRIALLTGGQFLYAAESRNLPGVYEMIAGQLKTRYRVRYRSLLSNSGRAQITVRLLQPAPAENSRSVTLTLPGTAKSSQIPLPYAGLGLLAVVLAVVAALVLSRRRVVPVHPYAASFSPSFDPGQTAVIGPDSGQGVGSVGAAHPSGGPTIILRRGPRPGDQPDLGSPEIGAARPESQFEYGSTNETDPDGSRTVVLSSAREQDAQSGSTILLRPRQSRARPPETVGRETPKPEIRNPNSLEFRTSDSGTSPLVLAQLVVRSGLHAGTVFPLAPDTSAKAEISIGSAHTNQVTVTDEGVLRYHAKLVYSSGKFVLYDLALTSRTTVNGRPLEGPTTLRNDDVIELASKVRLLFRDSPPDEEPGEEEP